MDTSLNSLYRPHCNLSEWADPMKAANESPDQGGVPEEPGIYLIRITGPEVLAYVGESGNLRNRIRKFWRSLNCTEIRQFRYEEPKFKCMLFARADFSGSYEVAWIASSENPARNLSDKQTRRACERWFLWQYRTETGHSTIANHSRATDDGRVSLLTESQRDIRVSRTTPSSITKTGVGVEPPSARPLYMKGLPRSPRWMGLRWSPFFLRSELYVGKGPDSKIHDPRVMGAGPAKYPALYKVADREDEILQLGCVQDAMEGTRPVLDRLPVEGRVSWCILPMTVCKYECHELLDDLIGAYYHLMGRAPKFQFTDS